MDEILKEFLIESHENLDRLDRDLVALEKDPNAKDTLASIFRTIHTLKGGSGFLAFKKLEAVAHIGENLLSKLRDGLIQLNPEITSALLATVDAVRYMLGQIESTEKEGDRDFSSLVHLLTQLNEPSSATEDEAAPPATNAVAEPTMPAVAPVNAPVPPAPLPFIAPPTSEIPKLSPDHHRHEDNIETTAFPVSAAPIIPDSGARESTENRRTGRF